MTPIALRLSLLFLLAGELLIGGAGQPARAANTRQTLVGTWRLVTYVDTPENGAPIRAFGEHPIGQFVFTADGYVSVHIMRNPPAIDETTADPDPDACVPGWYCAYFGTYTVDMRHGTWTTHVAGSNIPGFWHTDQSRSFTLDGNRLIIAETYLQGSVHVKAERILIRDVASPHHRP
jgi:hypothetical protein